MAISPNSQERARAFHFSPHIVKREGPMVPPISFFGRIIEMRGPFRVMAPDEGRILRKPRPVKSEFQRSDDRIVIGDVRNTVVGFRKDLETFRLGETAEIDVIDNLSL